MSQNTTSETPTSALRTREDVEREMTATGGERQATFAGVDPATFKALADSIAKDATIAELKAHLLICQRLGLPPVGGHAHFVPRRVYEKGQWIRVWSTQIGIDGYRQLAEETGLYEGPAGEPLFQYVAGGDWTENMLADTLPYAAKVGVYRKGRREPVWATALYVHYVQTTSKDRDVVDADTGERRKVKVLVPNQVWATRPHPQLAKCAEALALRKAFPKQLGGVYVREEMARASGDPEAPVSRRQEERVDPGSDPARLLPRERRGAEVVSPRSTGRPGASQRSSGAIRRESAPAHAAGADVIEGEAREVEQKVGERTLEPAEQRQVEQPAQPVVDQGAGVEAAQESQAAAGTVLGPDEPVEEAPLLSTEDIDRFGRILRGEDDPE